MAPEPMQVYGDSRSGNSYKVRLLCAQLGMPFEWHEVDVVRGETRAPAFLELNPLGKVPVVVLADGRTLTESNAILYYLAAESDLAGRDAFERADILRWMFFEQHTLEPNLATVRFIVRFLGDPPERRDQVEAMRARGYKALDTLEQRLAGHDFVANDRYSIADISLYAYVHVAAEGGFDLQRFPCVRAWLGRVARQPGHVRMEKTSSP
ncbi:MAG: glutathione S-transferase family protein [Woeseiaceae bacterium]|nr:glutathione S-transferase family protein [Woeseiaceae bacterium]